MYKLNEVDYSNLISMINSSSIKGSDCEYIALLKAKLEHAKKILRGESNGE